MDCEEVLRHLRAAASEKHRAAAVKLGIPEESSLGVSTAELRRIARAAGKSNALAFELWDTGYHEARLTAALVFEPEGLARADVERLMGDVVSWDLCDHLCKELIIRRADYESFINGWVSAAETYKKRAAFTLIAAAGVRFGPLPAEKTGEYLRLIRENSRDGRAHVKKAASWALREIGKSGLEQRSAALGCAREMLSSGDAAQAWIARDVIRELENCVKVEGVKRLVPAGGKMAGRR